DDGDILMFDLEAPSVPQENPASKSREVSTQTKPEVKDSSVKRYTLEIEDEKDESPRATYVEEEETDRFLQFKTMKKPVVEPQEEEEGEMDPMNAPISKVLRARTEERKRSLKAFNYKFRDNASRIDKIESEPAYKRQGIELTENEETGLSRTSINTSGEEDDIELRSNNSFLHDNVD